MKNIILWIAAILDLYWGYSLYTEAKSMRFLYTLAGHGGLNDLLKITGIICMISGVSIIFVIFYKGIYANKHVQDVSEVRGGIIRCTNCGLSVTGNTSVCPRCSHSIGGNISVVQPAGNVSGTNINNNLNQQAYSGTPPQSVSENQPIRNAFCNKCGSKLSAEDSYCRQCGNKIN